MKINMKFIRFIIIGIINTLNYYLLYTLLIYLEFNYMYSHIIAFIISLIISYFLNCYFVYHTKPTMIKFLKFPLTQLFNMSCQTLLLYLLVDKMHISELYAPIAALIITVPVTYIITSYILEDDKGDKNEKL